MEKLKFSFLSNKKNLNSQEDIAWGPDNFLAVSTENIVTIYRVHPQTHNYEIFRTITRHKTNITSMAWNHPTIELQDKNAFKMFLAIGDESGNVLVYDIFDLTRQAGISIKKSSTDFSICDLKWKLDDPSNLFVLTTQPALFSIQVGSKENLINSKMETFSINSVEFCHINIDILWFTTLERQFQSLSIDSYDPNRLLISSLKDFSYFNIKISRNNRNLISSNSCQYPIDTKQKFLHVEYFPFRPNYLLLLTDKTLYLYNLRKAIATTIVYFDNIQPFCFIDGIFSYSISNRFWLASIDGSIYRLAIDSEDEIWVVDSYILDSQKQLHGIFADFLHPTRICALFTDGIHIIEELPINDNSKPNMSQTNQNLIPQKDFLETNTKISYNSLESAFDDNIKNHPLHLHHSRHLNQDPFFSSNQDYQLFVTTIIPNVLGELKSWDAYCNQIACLSLNGYLTILSPKKPNEMVFHYLNLNHVTYRIKLKKDYNSVYFYDNNSVIVIGSDFAIINFLKRTITKHLIKVTSKFSISGNVFAYLTSPNVINITNMSSVSSSHTFSSLISHFCLSQDDNTKIAIISGNYLVILGYASDKKYELDEDRIGSVVQIAYSNAYVYLATTKSLIVQINVTTGNSYAFPFSSTSIRFISIYRKKYLCVCDMANLCAIFLIGDGKFTIASTSPCQGKEIHVLNDDFCLVQTKPSNNPMLTLYRFPSLEGVKVLYSTKENALLNEDENEYKMKVLQAKTIDDCQLVAQQIGDLSFIRFCQVVKHEENSILPSLFVTSKEKYTLNEQCFCTCNRQDPASIDEYVEYLILTNQNEKAAKIILKNINTQNILLANACLSSSTEEEKVVKKIIEMIGGIDGNERIFALLFKIANCITDYAVAASHIKDTLVSIKFIKMNCNNSELRKIIPKSDSNYLLMAFFEDFFETFQYLINNNLFSKAYAYMRYFEEKRIVFDDASSLTELKNKFNSEWYKSLELDMFL